MDLHIVGSVVDPALEAVTQELNEKWISKTNNPDLLVMYFLDEGSDWVVFVVYTDLYSGMARYAAQIPAELFYNGELDADYIMTQFKDTWEDGSVVAERLSKGESLDAVDDVDELDSAKRDYGGAYDVDPEAFFTKDDIVEFGNDICEDLTRNTACEVELAGAEIGDDGGHDFLTLTIIIDDDYEAQASINIDMRRIRKPSDIYKYKNEMLVEFMDDINEYLNIKNGVDMNSSKGGETTKTLSEKEKGAIKSLFERYGVPIEYTNDSIESDDGIEYQEYVVGIHNPSRKGYDRLMRALDNLEDEYDIGYWNDYHEEQGEVNDEIHFFHYPEQKLQSAKSDIKYVQAAIYDDCTPVNDLFSGSGGRSRVEVDARNIDTWDTADDAIAEGQESYREGVHWGVFEIDMSTRDVKKCVYDSREGKVSINCASSQVRNSVEVHVENQIENALEELMDDAVSAQVTAQEVADYDADWCAEDYPNDIATRIDKAMTELIQASVDLLMYNAPSELKK